MDFPVLDLAAFEAATGEDRRAIAKGLDAALRRTGFLVLRGHGVPQDLIDGVWQAAGDFFAQPPEVKARSAPVRLTAGLAPMPRRWPPPRAR